MPRSVGHLHLRGTSDEDALVMNIHNIYVFTIYTEK